MCVCVSCVGVCVVLAMFYTIHIFFFVMRVCILYMYNYSVCCGVTSVGEIDMKLVRNGEKSRELRQILCDKACHKK